MTACWRQLLLSVRVAQRSPRAQHRLCEDSPSIYALTFTNEILEQTRGPEFKSRRLSVLIDVYPVRTYALR